MSTQEVDIRRIYLDRDLRLPEVDLISRPEVVDLSKKVSYRGLALSLQSDLERGEFTGRRSAMHKEIGERLPDTPITIGLADEFLEELKLSDSILLIPEQLEDNRDKYRLIGDRSAVAFYEWREDALIYDGDNIALKLKKAIEDANDSINRLVTGNLRLVTSFVGQYHVANQDYLEYVQEGNIGLMHAARKFDWRKEASFPSYAIWWIRREVLSLSGRNRRNEYAYDSLDHIPNKGEDVPEESISGSSTAEPDQPGTESITDAERILAAANLTVKQREALDLTIGTNGRGVYSVRGAARLLEIPPSSFDNRKRSALRRIERARKNSNLGTQDAA